MVRWQLRRKLKAHAGINISQADHVTSNTYVKLSFFSDHSYQPKVESI